MLFRKMIRDIFASIGTYIACIVIIMIALISYCVFGIAYDNIEKSITNYYIEQKFADAFVEVMEMPINKIDELRGLKGIKEVDGRLSIDVKVLDDSGQLSGYLRLVSFMNNYEEQLNKFQLIKGKVPEDGVDSLLLGSKYFKANSMSIGDSINILVNGKSVSMNISGTCRSPEHVYSLKSEQEFYPDPEGFGIAYIPYNKLRSLTTYGAVVNKLSFVLERNVDFRDIKLDLEEKLDKYGVLKLYERKNQQSHLMLRGEVDGLKEIKGILPLIFLAIGGAILIIMLKRLIEKQRGQIGILKAFGFSDYEILIHYMSYSIVIGLCGGILGSTLGIIFAKPLVQMYQEIFDLPMTTDGYGLNYLIKGLAMGLVAALFAGYLGAKSSLSLEAAEAMRPATPKNVGKTFVEGIKALWNKLNMLQRIAVRNIFRNKGRSLFLLTGVVFTISLLGMSFALKENMTKMIFDQLNTVMRYDAKISMESPLDKNLAVKEFRQNKYIDEIETYVEVPSELSINGHKKLVNVIGIKKYSKLYNLADKDGNRVDLSESGLVISERLAGLLKVKVGDELRMKSPYSNMDDHQSQVTVANIIPQYLGINGYMEEGALMELLNQPDFITAVLINTYDKQINEIKKVYGVSKEINSIEPISQTKIKYESLTKMMESMIGIFNVVGMIAGFSIVYATSMITISERQRELASMLVIGMSYKEVRSIIYLEQWIISIFGFLMGLPILKLFIVAISSALNSDSFNIPTMLSIKTIFLGILLSVISILIAQFSIRKKLDEIKLVESLSIRE